MKKSFSFGIKKTANFNSVNVMETIEMDIVNQHDEVAFENEKIQLVNRVNKKANEEVRGLTNIILP